MIEMIKKELDVLEKYTEILSVAYTYDEETFIHEPLIYGGTERFIILGLKSIVDVCRMVIDYCNFKRTDDYREMIRILEYKKVYPSWLSESLVRKIKYIFTLKYDYLKYMNKKELYTLLEEIIRDFRHFKKYVLEYIV
ncbi:DUF86 domain-containing protein [Caloranaerobacter azorensis]|uniref:DUF86 domain-containing protein n=1 Tax=Caloranaerobacter azorensis TaxID=116090 RepID=A0A6P1YDZ3_9FIRM|nr:HepT-like ribonuclease domain-containing protein [Caloranaerobacter azorensis]QIB27550.1 DUF86 domain-containing protein [Caloranaerobacter azorensis]